MPLKFKMGTGRNVLFQCDVQEQHCRVCNSPFFIGGPLCAEHTKTQFHVIVKKSLIPNAGKGLFAWSPQGNANDVVFKKGDFICIYGGEQITVAELERRYPGDITGPYALRNGAKCKGHYVEDAACVRGIGSLANHGGNDSNAEYEYMTNPKGFILVASRDIRHDEEILCNYGESYDLNDSTYWNRTVPVSYVTIDS